MSLPPQYIVLLKVCYKIYFCSTSHSANTITTVSVIMFYLIPVRFSRRGNRKGGILVLVLPTWYFPFLFLFFCLFAKSSKATTVDGIMEYKSKSWGGQHSKFSKEGKRGGGALLTGSKSRNNMSQNICCYIDIKIYTEYPRTSMFLPESKESSINMFLSTA